TEFLKRVYVKPENSDIYYLDARTHNDAINAHNLVEFLLTTFKVVETINPKHFIDQLTTALNGISSSLGLSLNIKKMIKKSEDEILLCIACILHYSEFKMKTGEIPHTKLKFKVITENNKDRITLSPFLVMP